MAEPVDCSGFCRLCLVKEQVNIPIFEELGDLQQIYLKITACLPIKVSIEDPLPKRICDECSYKLDQQYQFWNTSLNSEKQLRQWLGLPEELPPSKSETSSKIKREKDHYESTTKRPRRNARRKAAQNVRQAAAAAIAAASDSGPGEDMDMDTFGAKEEHDTDNDLNDNTEPLTESTYMNVGIDSEEGTEAGPSGLQKNSDGAANPNQDSSGTGVLIKQEPLAILEIKQEESEEFTQTFNGYHCNFCGKFFLTKKYWKSHFVVHLKERPHKCEVCQKTFKRKNQLTCHQRIHNTERKKFICDICCREFASWHYFQDHQRRHNGSAYECDQCEKTFLTKYQLKNHIDVKHNHVRYCCDQCNKSFLSKEYLVRHAKTHDPSYVAPSLKCELCGKSYKSRSEYNRHVRSHEGFPCHQCGQIFKYAEKLKYHMYTHTGEKPYSCSFCEKRFRRKIYLTEHLRTHTKERPFECSVCGKGFTQRSPLKIHMRNHTGERPYTCKLCAEAFISKHRLTLHLQNFHCCSG